jgi:PilZ domain
LIMKSLSNLIEPPGTGFAEVVPLKRRRPYRQKIRTLVQVNLDAANGAILRDLSEFGIAMQTVAPLAPNQQVHLRFELPAPRVRVEAAGRIAWTDSWGQAGVQFLNLPQPSERLLKEWIFTQILSSAYLFSPCESVAVQGNRAEGATELLFSASPRPAIQLEPQPASPLALPDEEARPRSLRLLWCPVPISLSALSKLVDGLILLCAVLLFAVMAMAMTNILPTWPVTLALAIGVTAVFVALYWFLFVFWIGSTPGQHLARLACVESGNGMSGEEEDHARFR